MKKNRACIGVLALSAILAGLGRFHARAEASQDDPLVERGRYLVHHVAHCIQCHTPRDGEGELLRARLLEGAAVPLASPFERVEWAVRAPHVAGLPGYTEAQAVRLLTTGIAASGGVPRPPMPPFRMVEEDARAVARYLLSIGGRTGGAGAEAPAEQDGR